MNGLQAGRYMRLPVRSIKLIKGDILWKRYM